MAFAQFMASRAGRVLRVLAGVALLTVGLLVVPGVWGYVLAALALVPLLAGGLDVCVLGVLIGAPFRGSDVRGQLRV